VCQFFSCVSDGRGTVYYFDWRERQKFLKGELKGVESPDSHTSIADYYGFKADAEDRMNKYEYNPLTGKFAIDHMGSDDDSLQVKRMLETWNWKHVVKPLVVKPIINPLTDIHRKLSRPTKAEIELLDRWASVRDSVRASVGASVWDSVKASVWASVWASVGAYTCSFFDIRYEYDLSPVIKLWEHGLVPSFDGETWRLHAGPKAEIVYEGEKK
jgi:hypothetical protein